MMRFLMYSRREMTGICGLTMRRKAMMSRRMIESSKTVSRTRDSKILASISCTLRSIL